jgi:hypothetical protein
MVGSALDQGPYCQAGGPAGVPRVKSRSKIAVQSASELTGSYTVGSEAQFFPENRFQHSALSFQRSAFSVQHSALSFQLSAFSIQLSAFSVQHSAFSSAPSCLRAAPARNRVSVENV